MSINHPNQYFELAQKVAKGLSLSGGDAADGEASTQPSNAKRMRAVKVPLNESQVTNHGMDDASIDAELSKIDSSLLQEYAGIDF